MVQPLLNYAPKVGSNPVFETIFLLFWLVLVIDHQVV